MPARGSTARSHLRVLTARIPRAAADRRPIRGAATIRDEPRNRLPLCYLTTTGRRTGESRTVPLLHVADGDRIVLIASNWGGRRHPAWALNLDAAPEARVTVNGVERCTPCAASDPGRAAALLDRGRGDLARLRRLPSPGRPGGREIRVFVLEPSEREADRCLTAVDPRECDTVLVPSQTPTHPRGHRG